MKSDGAIAQHWINKAAIHVVLATNPELYNAHRLSAARQTQEMLLMAVDFDTEIVNSAEYMRIADVVIKTLMTKGEI